jgi:hypothetical protein
MTLCKGSHENWGLIRVRIVRHTADLNNGNDVEISVDMSTKCRHPPPTPSQGATERHCGRGGWGEEEGRRREEEERWEGSFYTSSNTRAFLNQITVAPSQIQQHTRTFPKRTLALALALPTQSYLGSRIFVCIVELYGETMLSMRKNDIHLGNRAGFATANIERYVSSQLIF